MYGSFSFVSSSKLDKIGPQSAPKKYQQKKQNTHKKKTIYTYTHISLYIYIDIDIQIYPRHRR